MSVDNIKHRIQSYKKKYYLRELYRGLFLTLISSISIFLIIVLLENSFWFPSGTRLFMFWVLLTFFLVPFIWHVVAPLLKYLQIRRPISDIQASKEIGSYFPEIKDKLINYLQISELSQDKESLVAAAIAQKTEELSVFRFEKAVDFAIVKKYLYGFLSLASIILLVSFINLPVITESSRRIIRYDEEFKRKAPFEFIIQNEDLQAFRNESYDLNIRIEGQQLPEAAYLLLENRRIKLYKKSKDEYGFQFNNVIQDVDFQLEAAGYYSDDYHLKLLERPELRSFKVELDYPAYTGQQDESLNNTGNLLVPEGTHIQWLLNTVNTEKASLYVRGGSNHLFKNEELNDYYFTQRALQGFQYEINLENSHARNKSAINYSVEVIKDEFPKLDVRYIPDSVFYQSVSLTGSIHDDYGISGLRIYYRKGFNGKFHSFPIEHSKKNSQQFFINWALDSLNLGSNETLELFVSVKDNDPINGEKEARSEKFYFKKPDRNAIDQILSDKSQKAEDQINKGKEEVQSLNERLKELEERLKTKNSMDWQEEKLANEILEDRSELEKSIEELKEKFEQLKDSQNQFNEQSERIQEKSEQLKQLMSELLDEKTKELYEELKKLLDEKAESEKLLNQLNKISSSEKNLEKELERALELFKRLKMESLLEENIQDISELAEKQEQLSNQDSGNEDIQKAQEQIKEDYQKASDKLDKVEELNQELKHPEPIQDLNSPDEEIKDNLEQLSEELKDGKKPNNATKGKQKETSEQMKSLAGKMSEMQSNMEMEMLQENIDNLKNILDDLVKLSFDEEELIEEFRIVSQSDPRFIELSQNQLQLMENAQVVEDSLYALAERVFQISGFLTREIAAINENLDNAMYELRERNKGKATSHQQFAMTSMNNLALLLSDVLQQMQEAMSMSSSPQKDGQISMSELQQQLSQQIEDLKKGNQSGRELSEELARLAAEQEMIRQQLQELKEKLSGQPDGEKIGDNLSEIMKEMEENEIDLVNKRITQQLINRQKKIVTRMLEAEESMREQKIDPEREGEQADAYERKLPPAYEEYLKARKSEIELLKTIPIELNPFYKKEVNDYFRRLSDEEK